MTLRADLVLTAAISLVFGLAAGLLIGNALGGSAAPAAAGASGGADHADHSDHADHVDPAEVARMLALHEELLAKNPDDVGLLQSVGEYRTMAGDFDGAIAAYDQALELARSREAEATLVSDLLLAAGVAQIEKGEVSAGLDRFAEASALDPLDVRTRLSSVWVLVNRVMMAPPPGWTRKDAVVRAEALLAEVLAIDPAQPDALEFQQLIDSMRRTAPGATAP